MVACIIAAIAWQVHPVLGTLVLIAGFFAAWFFSAAIFVVAQWQRAIVLDEDDIAGAGLLQCGIQFGEHAVARLGLRIEGDR